MAIAVAVAASSASAADYEFKASNGARCTFALSHDTPAEPGGTYTVSWRAAAVCDQDIAMMTVGSWLGGEDGSYWGTTAPYDHCGQPWNQCRAGRLISVEESVSGLSPQVFTETAGVRLVLPPPHVWVLVPKLGDSGGNGPLSCLPGTGDVNCLIKESFKPE